MVNIKSKKFILSKNFNYNLAKGVMYLYNTWAVLYLVMPSYYFKLETSNKLSLCFTRLNFYKVVLKSFLNMYKNIHYFYFFRLKLKGLGFRLTRLSQKLFMMFFGAYNFIYLHISMLVFTRGRNIIILDNDKKLLNIIFYQLLILKKMDLYSKKKTFYSFDKIKYFKKRI